MISNYMRDLEITNPFSHLKPWQKTPYEKAHGKNIYKTCQGKYKIEKVKNKEVIVYGKYDTFAEAVEARDELIKNGWVLDETVKLKQEQQKYYQNIYLKTRHYTIHKKDKFYGSTDTIEKALYYRDICKEHNWEYDKKPIDLDLTTDNPYLEDGLKYPVPERLELPPEKPKDKGYITRPSPQSNQVRLSHTYFGAYPTRELADKISNDLQACNWDKSKLKEIQARHGWQSKVHSKRWVYPQYYTSRKTGERYVTNYTVRRKSIGYFGTYKDKRVAELVRDQLVEYGWEKDKLSEYQEYAYFVIDQADNCWRCR